MSDHQARLDEYDRMAADKIVQYGVYIQHVFPVQESDGPRFSYTVGLADHDDHPEIIIFALEFETTQVILNNMAQEVIRHDQVYEPGPIRDLVEDYTCYLIEVVDTRTHLTMANRFYSSPNAPISALQLVWPDLEGRLPWEQEYSLDPATQPILGMPPT